MDKIIELSDKIDNIADINEKIKLLKTLNEMIENEKTNLNSIIDNVVWISIACSHDGQIIAAAGSEFIGSGNSVLNISLDGGLSWIPIIVE